MTITKEMSIGDVVREYPETVPVFLAHGLGCLGCALAHYENIAQGAKAHGIDLEALMAALNEAITAREAS